MAATRGPLLLYVLPLLAVAVLGLSTFLGTQGGIVRSAVVLGGPTDGPEPFRGRLQVVEEVDDVVTPVGGESIVLAASRGSHGVERRLVTNETGWAEFELPLRGQGPLLLEIFDSRGKTLARGPTSLSTERWLRSARRREGQMRVQKRDDLKATLSIVSRVLAVPFTGDGELRVMRNEGPLSGARARLEGVGADVRGPGRGVTDEDGRLSFSVAAQEHVAALRVTVDHGELSWVFQQALPVVPGAFWFRRVDEGFEVLAPVPRDEAWYTFVTETARFTGGRLTLRENERGFFTGTIPSTAVPRAEGLFLVLASSADARSASTVGYPLDGQNHTLDVWDAYLLDGGPAERRRVEKRRRKIRLTLGAYAGLSGLLTLLLFVFHIKRSDRELSARLEDAGADAATRESSPLPLLVAAIGLFFAFSAGVLWIVAR